MHTHPSSWRGTARWALFGVGLAALGAAGVVLSDDDGDEAPAHHGGRVVADVPVVTDAAYATECGACHMAYQPGLLPAAAWDQIMTSAALAAHYGENASLPDDTRATIAAYLTAHAADPSASKRARAFAVGVATTSGATLPRITATRYFLREHAEVPPRLVQDNPEVRSFSRCDSCHRDAAAGNYSERQIDIPGHGPWRD